MNLFRNAVKRSHNADAVVTGAGSGIGAAFAIEIARRGGRVVCADIDRDTAARTVSTITDAGGEALALQCDVSKIGEVEQLADRAQAWFNGPPTLIINNAGVGMAGTPIGEISVDDWNWVLGINLWGVIHGCHVFAPILRDAVASRPCGIINVASAAAFGAAPGMAAYNVSKAGALSLSETLAAELTSRGINVTVLCPTLVKTNILQSSAASGHMPAQTAELADRMMRWIGFSPERVARACLDTNDRGGLYCVPQPDARIGWAIKRLAPTIYARALGFTTRSSSGRSRSEKVS